MAWVAASVTDLEQACASPSRGDRNRNARLVRLRASVPSPNAIVGIDLADATQMVVVCDHDSKVLARKTFRGQTNASVGNRVSFGIDHLSSNDCGR